MQRPFTAPRPIHSIIQPRECTALYGYSISGWLENGTVQNEKVRIHYPCLRLRWRIFCERIIWFRILKNVAIFLSHEINNYIVLVLAFSSVSQQCSSTTSFLSWNGLKLKSCGAPQISFGSGKSQGSSIPGGKFYSNPLDNSRNHLHLVPFQIRVPWH